MKTIVFLGLLSAFSNLGWARSETSIVVPLPTDLAQSEAVALDHPRYTEFLERLAHIRVARNADEKSLEVRFREIDSELTRLYRRDARGLVRIEAGPDNVFLVEFPPTGALEIEAGVVYPSSNSKRRWPSKFNLQVRSPPDGVTRTVALLRVTPFILPSSLDPVDEVLIAENPSTEGTVAQLKALSGEGRFKLVTVRADGADVWMQDTIEPGLYPFPNQTETRQARGSLTGLRREFGTAAAGLDKLMEVFLLEKGFSAFEPGVPRKKTNWIDWYGNLEVTPNFTGQNGRRFPYGRLITGKQNGLGMHPGVLSFLESQRVQWPPLEIDTSWLLIGHVDEVVSFVPAKNKAGFLVLLPSPRAARDLLDWAIEADLGELAVFENTAKATTLKELRESVAASEENEEIDSIVDKIQAELASALALEESDFVRLPVLFERGMAVIPNGVNSLIANGYIYVPDPRGPRHEGKDLFQESIRDALRNSSAKVRFVDVWGAYHTRGGELHCGTNTLRHLRRPAWWELSKKSRRPRSDK